ncbi:MAG: DUF1501 domain-containing protein [Pseudomonadota bacterium]
MLDRRSFLSLSCAGLTTAALLPRSVFAALPGTQRFVVVLLRGGLDGLHALVPYSDPNYARLRPKLHEAMLSGGGYTKLDSDFALHHALSPLQEMFETRELLFVPAASTQYRQRSHFDGQNLLENGSGKPFGAKTGWLNRAVSAISAKDQRLALSIGPTIPLILQGASGVQTWANSRLTEVDDEFLIRMARAFKDDPLFSATMTDAINTSEPDIDMSDMKRRRGQEFTVTARAAADLLAQPEGPRVAVLDAGGWDTHFDQERRLALGLGSLAAGLVELKQGLTRHWKNTVVVVVSEFGRTAAENANRGTDHGTGGLAMLCGGAVAGGRIVGDWAGLSKKSLYESRDVRSLNSYESIFKTVLLSHLQVPEAVIETSVFPNSSGLAPMSGLLTGA